MNGRNTGQRQGGARARILAAAAERFYADGIAGTGVDTITAEAGVAKMSLYNNFASKAELVEQYLLERHEEWLGLYQDRVGNAHSSPQRVLAVFDAYIDHAEMEYAHGFRGCGLLNAAAELPVGSPGREAVRRHKEQVEGILADHFRELTDEACATDAAEHCAFLLEGAMSRAGLEGDPSRLERAKTIAACLVEAL